MPNVGMPSAEEAEKKVQKGLDWIEAARFRIKWKDIFNVVEFYKALHFWLGDYGWSDIEDGRDHYETLYLEKVNNAGMKELLIKWRPQKKIRSFYKYHLDFDFHFIGLKPTEVVRDGKKLSKGIYDGEVEVWVNALIELDPGDEWENHFLLKHFKKIFIRRIFHSEISKHKLELYREAYILQNFIKRWLQLKRYLPYEEIKEEFYKPESYPKHLE